MRNYLAIFGLVLLTACGDSDEKMQMSTNPELDEAAKPQEKPAAIVAESSIQHITWNLEQLNGKPAVTEGKVANIVLGVDNKLTGNTGVNSMFGTYNLENDTIHISDIGSTKMAGPADAMEQESAFTTTLTSVDGFRVEDGKLLLLKEGEILAVLTKGTSPQ